MEPWDSTGAGGLQKGRHTSSAQNRREKNRKEFIEWTYLDGLPLGIFFPVM
jgi:hypothetical protein